mgnify:CR=1 FL=1|jgi:uncharacterized membrane protein YfcA
MSITTGIILLIAGFLTGAVNTVSAAGSLISMPALMFAGLPIQVANGTNRIAIAIQCFTATQSLKKAKPLEAKYLIQLTLASLPGAVLGSWYAVSIDANILHWTLRILVLLFIGLTIFNPIKTSIDLQEKLSKKQKWGGIIAFFFIGIYGGFIQAGTGFFMMATSLALHRFPMPKTNYIKAFVMLSYTIIALAVFVYHDMVDWPYGILLSIGGAAGAWITGKWSLAASPIATKITIVSILVLLSIKLWWPN